jgi:glucosamine--fructose-6-phosphate aminotransferase (isomerizing)
MVCGIVGAAAQRNVVGILLEGLRRLEYRGYDSAGLAILGTDTAVKCIKKAGKVAELAKKVDQAGELVGKIGNYGIAHTRWATHGVPNEENAHPHLSSDIAVVHNGIIENHEALREELQSSGYVFASQTDSEVVAHLIHFYRAETRDLKTAGQKAVDRLDGAYALAVLDATEPDVLIGARHGSPLVIGVGIGENFVASDPLALRQVTDRFVYLGEGELAEVRTDQFQIFDKNGRSVTGNIVTLQDSVEGTDKGVFRHYMLKEIYQQPAVLAATLQGRITDTKVLSEAFGGTAPEILKKVKNVHIVACGTSYHAGLVARYWLEEWAGILCQVEVASEYRYRAVVVPENCLFVSLSQSGETADTLAALKASEERGYLATMTICNVANSALVRESDLVFLTQAGPEIGVASTKAFTTQLVALQLLCVILARYRGRLDTEREAELVRALHQLPEIFTKVLTLDEEIERTFECFVDKHHALFLGRGVQYPIALEGALKLKEISYIHAEAYPSGELKHGPLALVDADMPVVAVAPNNDLLEKLKSNLHEVKARGGKLFVFADSAAGFSSEDDVTVLELPHVPPSLEAIIYTLPLQLLSYHVAVLKGTDVDQPRNLAKSVTVE